MENTIPTKNSLRWFLFTLTAAIFFFNAVSVAGANKNNLVFILDASGSMWRQVEGTAKITIAKDVLGDLISGLPQDLNVGLVAYGHNRKGDCRDVEELIPLGELHKERLIAKIKELNPKGKTPITHSIQITAEKLSTLEDETTIILVSDGKETCEGDPCALVRELRQSGVRFVMHVIGFDVTDEERNQLECIAGAGGGIYYSAKNAGEFQIAAQKVVMETQTVGFLEVTALRNGKPVVAHIEVLTPDKATPVTTTNSSSKRDKPATIRLKPGTYTVKVTDARLPDKPTVTLQNVEIEVGRTVGKTVEFSASYLQILTTKDGQPFQAWVYVYRQGEKKELTYKHTATQPASFELMPGIYDIKVRDDSVPEKPEIMLKGLELKPGDTLERIIEFSREGILEITPIKEGKLFKAWVYVYRQGEKKELTYKHTATQPASFKLMPGIYDIKVRDDSVPEKPEITVKGLEVKSAETLEKAVEFMVEGVLEVTPVKEGKLFKAWVYVYRQGDKKELTYKHTATQPASFKLLPGIYDIKVKDDATKSVQELNGVAIESGKTQATVVAF